MRNEYTALAVPLPAAIGTLGIFTGGRDRQAIMSGLASLFVKPTGGTITHWSIDLCPLGMDAGASDCPWFTYLSDSDFADGSTVAGIIVSKGGIGTLATGVMGMASFVLPPNSGIRLRGSAAVGTVDMYMGIAGTAIL